MDAIFLALLHRVGWLPSRPIHKM